MPNIFRYIVNHIIYCVPLAQKQKSMIIRIFLHLMQQRQVELKCSCESNRSKLKCTYTCFADPWRISRADHQPLPPGFQYDIAVFHII